MQVKIFITAVIAALVFTIGNLMSTKMEIEDWSARENSLYGDVIYEGKITHIYILNSQLKIYDNDVLILQKNLELLIK